MGKRLLISALAITLLSGLTACGTTQGKEVNLQECVEPITVFAASSLTKTMTQIASDFEKKNGDCSNVKLVFGASSALAQQINAGAPVNIFISASPAAMKTAEANIAVSSVYLRNQVVVALGTGVEVQGVTASVLDGMLIDGKPVKWIMCALEVPCGSAGKKALDADGIKSQPISLEPDVKSVVAKLTSKEVDAAIVYHTDVVANPGLTEIPFGDAKAATTDYMLGLTKTDSTLAQSFLAFVQLPENLKILSDAGFDTDMSK